MKGSAGMTLDEKIEYYLEIANNENMCKECREQHLELVKDLKELKYLRAWRSRLFKVFNS
jgi:hypothetical protein